MVRAILGIVAGYAVMAVIVTVSSLGGFVALGVDRFFQPDSYEVSTLWLVLSAAVSVGSAMVGGYVCAAISRSMKAVKILALIIFVLGVLLCLPKMRDDPHVRAGDVPALQVANLAQMPVWMHLLTPLLGVAGVFLGARMKSPR